MTLNYRSAHEEVHFLNRAGWLRAAVLGANDGIVSVSSLNADALALIDCQLEEAIERHSHTILIGHPTHIRIRERAEPLVYWHGAYRLLSSLDRVLTRA